MTALTLAELEALPLDAVVVDCDGDKWRRVQVPRWQQVSGTGGGIQQASLIHAHYAPIRLESSPTVAAEWPLHMTRCVHEGCQSTHALPPGSSYACPLHSTNLTTRGTR